MTFYVDIYIACLSSNHKVCPQGFYVAIISTIAESDNPEKEIQPALQLLAPVKHSFTSVTKLYEPVSDGRTDKAFISKSLDATTIFETVCADVKSIYKRYTGSDLVVKDRSNDSGAQDE